MTRHRHTQFPSTHRSIVQWLLLIAIVILP